MERKSEATIPLPENGLTDYSLPSADVDFLTSGLCLRFLLSSYPKCFALSSAVECTHISIIIDYSELIFLRRTRGANRAGLFGIDREKREIQLF